MNVEQLLDVAAGIINDVDSSSRHWLVARLWLDDYRALVDRPPAQTIAFETAQTLGDGADIG